MSKSYVFVVQPSGGKVRPLTVDDAMHQVLDLVEWLRASARAEGHEGEYDWVLKKATTNSPFRVEIEPQPKNENLVVWEIADKDFSRALDGLRDISEGKCIPPWLDRQGLNVGKRLLRRNMNGIGLTEAFRADAPETMVHLTPALSEKAIENIRLYEAPGYGEMPQHRSYGEAVGRFLRAGTYHRRPAFWIASAGGAELACRLTEEKARQIGHAHTLDEVWGGAHVRVIGYKYYDESGEVRHIEVDEAEAAEVHAVGLDSVIDRDFTGGRSSREHLDRLREGDG